MYPRLSDVFRDLLGFEFPIPIYSFGAMVAEGALVAGWLLGKELDRYYRAGRLNGVRMKVDTKKDAGNTSKKRKGAARRRSSHKLVAPSNAVWLITMVALGSGFLGARVFHILENLDQFAADPGGMLFASGGFTFYGGLIVATFIRTPFRRPAR